MSQGVVLAIFGYITVAAIAATWVIMQWKGKTPSTKSWHEFLDAINSRGGNILVLSIFSGIFFKCSIALFIWVLEMLRDGKITPDNAIALMALQFVTGSAFGGAWGAMLKTMTADSGKGRMSDSPNTTTTTTTSQSTAPIPTIPAPEVP